ncbi:hypothetical protein KUCAC02_000190 [Chaenocephalus aceratus]|uniref:Uncharacterized protein n=1 Tax=Chaenocephalus aceratus TaxID=36190 RepID=A0ACB9W4P1_CHAAC|nr:hypothetical protein KUCAC02_000190 [Chaenocephalus aceratus]
MAGRVRRRFALASGAMAMRFLTAREVLGKLYANATAQYSTNLSEEEEEEEEEDEPRGQGVRGEEDVLEYGDEVRVYEDKDHEEEVSGGKRKEQSGHRETRGRNPEPEAQSEHMSPFSPSVPVTDSTVLWSYSLSSYMPTHDAA